MSEENPQKMAAASGARMKDFNCDALELSFQFPTDEIDENAFLQAVKLNKEEFIDADGDLDVGLDVSANEEATDYHAHMRLTLPREGEGRLSIRYHNSRIEIPGGTPPDAEDCARWAGQFLKTDQMRASIQAVYIFDKSYSPVIALPFPLITSEKALAGSLVTGLSIFMKGETSTVAIIQMGDDVTHVSLSAYREINLKEFDLLTELDRLSAPVSLLVKRKEAVDASDNN